MLQKSVAFEKKKELKNEGAALLYSLLFTCFKWGRKLVFAVNIKKKKSFSFDGPEIVSSVSS